MRCPHPTRPPVVCAPTDPFWGAHRAFWAFIISAIVTAALYEDGDVYLPYTSKYPGFVKVSATNPPFPVRWGPQ